jgi:hypothetical protein
LKKLPIIEEVKNDDGISVEDKKMISDMNKMLSANHRKSMELMMMDDSSEQKSSDEIDD